MGEAAEMMLDGTCCSSCGEFLECNFDLDAVDEDGCLIDEAPGFPMMCAACQFEAERRDLPVKAPTPKGERKKRRLRERKRKGIAKVIP